VSHFHNLRQQQQKEELELQSSRVETEVWAAVDHGLCHLVTFGCVVQECIRKQRLYLQNLQQEIAMLTSHFGQLQVLSASQLHGTQRHTQHVFIRCVQLQFELVCRLKRRVLLICASGIKKKSLCFETLISRWKYGAIIMMCSQTLP
jgi:hypothetical protein